MKRFALYSLGILLCSTLISATEQYSFERIQHRSFAPGEVLHYRAAFGFIGIGNARMEISDKIQMMNNRPVYRLDVYGKTTGMVDWVAKVDDHWGSYIDTTALLPHMSMRHIREGDYRKNEVTRFYHDGGRIETRTLDQATGEYKAPKVYHDNAKGDIRDILAGYLYLRAVDFSSMKKGDSFKIRGFLEDTFYDINMIFEGHEKIKTKAGKFRAIKITPEMPEGGIFDGKRSVNIWISADENKIPLRIEAKMFVGKTTLELEDYSNVRNPIALDK